MKKRLITTTKFIDASAVQSIPKAEYGWRQCKCRPVITRKQNKTGEECARNTKMIKIAMPIKKRCRKCDLATWQWNGTKMSSTLNSLRFPILSVQKQANLPESIQMMEALFSHHFAVKSMKKEE